MRAGLPVYPLDIPKCASAAQYCYKQEDGRKMGTRVDSESEFASSLTLGQSSQHMLQDTFVNLGNVGFSFHVVVAIRARCQFKMSAFHHIISLCFRNY